MSIVSMAFLSTKAFAVHKGAGNLVCGACHTMHNSEGNANMGYTGAQAGPLRLLRANVDSSADIHKLCLNCHGSGPNAAYASSQFSISGSTYCAPKVYLNNTAVWDQSKDFSALGAGGYFDAVIDNTWALQTDDAGPDGNYQKGYGHSIGATTVTPPGGTQISNFSCTNCHDPHGTNSSGDANINIFRNLRKQPTGSTGSPVALAATGLPSTSAVAATSSYIGGVTGAVGTGNYITGNKDASTGTSSVNSSCTYVIWPVYNGGATCTGNTASCQNQYWITNPGSSGASNTDTDSVSLWCATCHTNWHEKNSTGNDANPDWRRHPVSNKLVDSTISSGSGVDIVRFTQYSSIPVGYKLPAWKNVLSAGDRRYYADTSTSDAVGCLSCHFAHGGPNRNALRWSHNTSNTSDPGSAVPIASNIGCQQCHNR